MAKEQKTNAFGITHVVVIALLGFAVVWILNPSVMGEVKYLIRLFVAWASRGLSGARFWVAEPPLDLGL